MKRIKGIRLDTIDADLFEKLIRDGLRVAIHFRYLPSSRDEDIEEIEYHFEGRIKNDIDYTGLLYRCVQIASRLSDPFKLGGLEMIPQDLEFMLNLAIIPNKAPVFIHCNRYYERTFTEVYPKGWKDFHDRDESKVKRLEGVLKGPKGYPKDKSVTLDKEDVYKSPLPKSESPPKSRDSDLKRLKDLEMFLSDIKEDDTSS